MVVIPNPDDEATRLFVRLKEPLPTDLSLFADDLRRLMTLRKLSDADWTHFFQLGIRTAIARSEWLSVAEFAHIALSRHEVQGRMARFVEEMDWALAISAGDPDAMLYLLSLRGVAEASIGDLSAAADSIVAASQFRTGTSAHRAVSRFEANRMIVDLRSLREDADEVAIEKFIRDREDTAVAGVVTSAYIRYLTAHGRIDEARRWTPLLAKSAVDKGRLWQAAEAEVYAYALDSVGSGGSSVAVSRRYYTAAWTLATSGLRTELLSGRSATGSVTAVSALVDRVEPAARDGATAFAAVTRAYSSGALASPHQPPSHLSLHNLGSALAGLEAVALAGSDEQVERWLEWYDATWPEHVVTSLEWRASAPRLRGLLLLRLGRLDEALECLDAAIERPVSTIEGDIAELQRFELTDPEHPRRAAIWERLAVAGVAPHPQAYAALSALRRAERASTPDREGAPEVERRR